MGRRLITAGRLRECWRTLPFGSLDEVIGDGTCLILAPHPDDESLGCGGLIASCCAVARPPLVVILTDGSGSHPNYPPARLIALREAEATNAANILGLPKARLKFLREQDTRAPDDGPAFERIVHRLADCVRRFGCSAILTTWRHDPHCDHHAAARIAREIARVSRIIHLEYPIWGWTMSADTQIDEAAVRGWRFDVTQHLPAKRRAIAAHASQYGQVITDDPAGFTLPDSFLRAFAEPWETFLLP
jgi:LmbE family N-acetylglucosaminyl deacetylase